MQYQCIIKCLECEADILQEDLDKPANLTKDQVLERSEHTSKCDIRDIDIGMIDVRNAIEDALTTYTIKALRQ